MLHSSKQSVVIILIRHVLKCYFNNEQGDVRIIEENMHKTLKNKQNKAQFSSEVIG